MAEFEQPRSLLASDPVSGERSDSRENPRGRWRRFGPFKHDFSDMASVLGIPERRLTPEISSAIAAFSEELSRLQSEVEHLHSRLAYAEEAADQHSFLPVINRRAFQRELTRLLAYTERIGAPSNLVWIDVRSAVAIKRRFGHAAADAALRHVAAILIEGIRQTDVVGSLGGTDFGLILTQTDKETAVSKAEQLIKAITDAPLHWKGETFLLDAIYRVHTFLSGESVEDALDRADPALAPRE
jgi:diguanylate cyclase (GGDEF)-like protein